METTVSEIIDSDALRANLRETAQQVTIKAEYHLLLDVVSKYRGIHNNLESLLFELCHSFRNWSLILPRLRSYLLKNCHIYKKDPRVASAFTLFADIFLQSIMDSEKNDAVLSQSVEALFAWLDKLISLFSLQQKNDTALYELEPVLNDLFMRLNQLDTDAGTGGITGESTSGTTGGSADESSGRSTCGITGRAMMHIVQGHHAMRKMISRILALSGDADRVSGFDCTPLALLMHSVLKISYYYWLGEDDPELWLSEQSNVNNADNADNANPDIIDNLFESVCHRAMHDNLKRLAAIDIEKNSTAALKEMMSLPAYMDIVRAYKNIPEQLTALTAPEITSEVQQPAENLKLRFLFRIMDTSGLYLIHEDALREINHSLVKLIRQQSFEKIENFLLTTFKLLKANVKKYPHTSLKCIQVLGDEVFKRGNSRMVETFLWEAVRFGFQQASVAGVDEDWQPITNPAHLTNIRVWLHLITQEPKWCSTLFSALIINIKLAGTCVKDTDLFQRDITHLLNHPIEPVYNLVKQFAKLMPVFFNEIGAEGELRYVSTELDEVHKRKDRLIHFLRKQAHVESTNLVVEFIREIFIFWITRNKQPLSAFVPQETYEEIETHGPFIDELHSLVLKIHNELDFSSMDDTLSWDKKERKKYLNAQKEISIEERRRFDLIVQMYRLVHQKYNLSFQDLKSEFAQADREGFLPCASGMLDLLDVLKTGDTAACLEALLNQLEKLKDVILSDETFTAEESIQYKRHIAVDIPSMYGSYHEHKFDSLSLTFRLENLAAPYLEKLPERVNLSLITRATFFRIADCLKLYLKALAIDGITSRSLDTHISLLHSALKIRRFSYTQYMDIFRGFSEGVKDVIYACYTNIHQNNLSIIIPQIDRNNLSPRYRSEWPEHDNVMVNTIHRHIAPAHRHMAPAHRHMVHAHRHTTRRHMSHQGTLHENDNDNDMINTTHRLSETFFRDLIASTFGLQHLDNFITKIIQTLERQKNILNQDLLDLLMTYNPENSISMLHDYNPCTHDLIHLSNKGFNLISMTRDNLPVPPAFIITTEIFRCRDVVYAFPKAKEDFMNRIREALSRIEGMSGKVFGSPDNPLLVSVRSGSALSMPGMMATIHNVGLNEELIEECVALHGNTYLVWDNYRRFIQSWAMISGDMDRDDFQELMDEAKERHQVKLKWQFTPEQMRELALNYQRLVRRKGVGIPEDPWLQLAGAVEMVLDSWENTKAIDYRRVMDLSDAWGTAVIVQAMVFGNKSSSTGSGVLFTSHPYRKVQRVALWGDYAYGDQGEDIVSGLVTSYPISVEQAELDGRNIDKSLEIRFPKIYEKLLSIARELVYQKRWNPQEMEFTFEGPEPEHLYLLQTRDMITIKKKEQFDVFIETDALKRSFLGKGIGVSGSAISGLAVFSEENIRAMREKFTKNEIQQAPLILILQDSVPEDIKVIDMADGLLTSRGGQTSHASVVAVRLEKTCVVGCRQLKVYESRQYCDIEEGKRIVFGDPVSIDGRNGRVFEGDHAIENEMHILPIS